MRALRAEAGLGAIRCAIELADDAELDGLAAFWQTQDEAEDAQPIVGLCVALVKDGRLHAARLLADAEAHRAPSPRSWYLLRASSISRASATVQCRPMAKRSSAAGRTIALRSWPALVS